MGHATMMIYNDTIGIFLGEYACDKIVSMFQNARRMSVNDLYAGILDNLTGMERI
jgi:hypothetical protein